MKHSRRHSGFTTIQVIVTSVFLISLGLILASAAVIQMQFATSTQRSENSVFAAEAGVNYYLWHLSHKVDDYCDGSTCPTNQGADGYGPFTHDYKEQNGTKIGTYSIYVKPPSQASNGYITVKSIGKVGGKSRTVQAQITVPTFASYSILSATEAWFGSNETFNGPAHSNVGLHIDGTVNGTASSAQATYNPTSQFGCNTACQQANPHPGVWGSGGPNANWKYPVPPVDFNQVTANLQQFKTTAQANNSYLAPSGRRGYLLRLKNNKTIDVYKVNSESCTGLNTTFSQNMAKPSTGILFAEDDVWVQSNGNQPNVEKYTSQLTIAAGRFPDQTATNASISIVGDILYNAKDGTNSIGLVAQKDIRVTRYAPSTLEIDAALLGQKGHVWYNKNNLSGSTCSNSVKTKITSYGAIATNLFWTWTYVSGNSVVDGYTTTINTFDTNLRNYPPPSWPTTGTFQIINYRELLENP